MHTYKKTLSNKHQCISNYIDIGEKKNGQLPNNIAYYIIGDRNSVNQLKLVVNINQYDYSEKAINTILAFSKGLLIQALGTPLPREISTAITSPKSFSKMHYNFDLRVEHFPWKSGNRHEIKLII